MVGHARLNRVPAQKGICNAVPTAFKWCQRSLTSRPASRRSTARNTVMLAAVTTEYASYVVGSWLDFGSGDQLTARQELPNLIFSCSGSLRTFFFFSHINIAQSYCLRCIFYRSKDSVQDALLWGEGSVDARPLALHSPNDLVSFPFTSSSLLKDDSPNRIQTRVYDLYGGVSILFEARQSDRFVELHMCYDHSMSLQIANRCSLVEQIKHLPS